ncbi:hypothetical protein C1T17_02690 [Sphingobium sp. SCG-1]|uniref:zinc-binding dehydrogenase n=1 Tax=Sphingobium sp. SCG-1 TaxID=2072936 RepID=UPI000CD6BB68|nr:zinc-binding dehydrogenase [Sphingobium sp. SCG-1]AUW57153.1 hypothetical protein C1T17_02690 [Sphingobium sp. SCG-1]
MGNARPDGFRHWAAFRVGFVTAYEALVRLGRIRAGGCVVVLGASGTVGLAAVQLASTLGARVIASASTEEKRVLAIAHGADAAVETHDPEWRRRVSDANGGRPVDIVFDPVGGDATEPAFRNLGWNGRHLMVGFASGALSRTFRFSRVRR